METKAPWIQRTTIGDELLEGIYASDQDMYPAPLTYERLKSWVDGCPELCICFQAPLEDGADPAPIGVVIILPVLKRFWEDVLVGKLKEIDIDPMTMFAGDGEADVGLHVFHIERFDAGTPSTRLRHFAELALENTRDIVEKKGWNILGYSALTATPAGRAVCRRMDFKPTGYEEIFVTNSEATGGVTVDMVYVYPDGAGDAPETHGKFHSKSEMVVRYLNDRFWHG